VGYSSKVVEHATSLLNHPVRSQDVKIEKEINF
jgi:hypothetical protein